MAAKMTFSRKPYIVISVGIALRPGGAAIFLWSVDEGYDDETGRCRQAGLQS
jgi:hypothetical protein